LGKNWGGRELKGVGDGRTRKGRWGSRSLRGRELKGGRGKRVRRRRWGIRSLRGRELKAVEVEGLGGGGEEAEA
jgi:hypothetical protein